MLQSTELQKDGHDLTTEQQQQYFIIITVSVRKAFGEKVNLYFSLEYIVDWACPFLNDSALLRNENSRSILRNHTIQQCVDSGFLRLLFS